MQAGAHARLLQQQLASLQQQLDGEQERSRELESANAQFNECTNRLRNERNALQVQCNELKKERARAVLPLSENNGRA
eukprot:scaffold30613_cov70-Phaeocystis_antarctica.AAC.2